MTSQATDEFPPHVLREYALLADGERGALCGPRGDIAWLCAPGWAGDAICSSLLGGEGVYAVTPVDRHVWGGYYEAGTLVWRNRWVTNDTILECHDALAFPGDPHTLVVLRRVVALGKGVRVRVVLDLRGGFGRRSMRQAARDDSGCWTAATGDLRIRWSGAPRAHVSDDGRLELEIDVAGGTHHDLVLEVSDRPLGDPLEPDAAWQATRHSWESAVPAFEDTVAPRDARHSYAVLRGLTASGGGMVAAATLGLPERAEAGRNYDYRYVWLRDQCYAGIAAGVHDPHPLLDAAVSFITARVLEHGDQLVPAYRTDGTGLPEESTLSIPGYPGGSPVVGNWVNGQFQLDSLGEVLQLLATAARHDRLDTDARRAMHVATDVIEKKWNQPEAGIWELGDAWWTQSRLACVAGLREIASAVPASEGARMAGLAETIMAETSRRCLAPSGAWQRSPDHAGVDASLLLPPVRGAASADDPRTLATLAAVENDLVQDGYVYRFAADGRPLGEAEGAFLLCGFTMSLALSHQGRTVEAFRWFERTRAGCGPPGLLSEEFDVSQRQMRGNLPQAFVHASLLETATRLAPPASPPSP